MPDIILSAEEYASRSCFALLQAAARGHVGIDQRWLRALLSRPLETAEAIVRFGEENHEDYPEDLTTDCVRMLRHLRRPEGLPFLIAAVEASPEDVDYDLVAAFRELVPASVEPLIDLYHRCGQEAASEVAFVLASLGVKDDRIREVLIDHLEHDAVEAGHCLATYGDPAAAPLLRSAAAVGAEPWQQASLEASAATLESGEPAGDEEEPFDLFADYPEEADPRFDLLEPGEVEAFLASPDPVYRSAAIEDLTHEGVPSSLISRLFDLAQHDPSPEVRGRAWEALGEVAGKHTNIHEAMVERVRGEQYPPEERCGALVALAPSQGDQQGFRQAVLRFYDAPETRVKAIQAMILSTHEEFIPYFSRHLEDPDEIVRLQAIQGVGFYELSEEAERLVPAFGIEELREEALPCYALAAEADLNRRGLRALYERIERLAGSLSEDEEMSVKDAINLRLARHEMEPLYSENGEILAPVAAVSGKPGRNDPCPCGSGKKYKKCCGH